MLTHCWVLLDPVEFLFALPWRTRETSRDRANRVRAPVGIVAGRRDAAFGARGVLGHRGGGMGMWFGGAIMR